MNKCAPFCRGEVIAKAGAEETVIYTDIGKGKFAGVCGVVFFPALFLEYRSGV